MSLDKKKLTLVGVEVVAADDNVWLIDICPISAVIPFNFLCISNGCKNFSIDALLGNGCLNMISGDVCIVVVDVTVDVVGEVTAAVLVVNSSSFG